MEFSRYSGPVGVPSLDTYIRWVLPDVIAPYNLGMAQPPSTSRRRGARGPAPVLPVNIRDVARLAGVSPATVSRVFSGKSSVSQGLHDKVIHAADELGYVVNHLAMAMMGTGLRQLGFIASQMSETTAEIFSGVEQIATRNGRLVMTCLTHDDDELEKHQIDSLCQQRVAAVIRVGPTETDAACEARIASYAAALEAIGARLILADHHYIPSLPQILTVSYDQLGGARQAVAYLAGKGHTRIAFLGWAKTATANQRFLGYSLGMKQAGLKIDSACVVQCADQISDAHLSAMPLLKNKKPPTAIVCVSDLVAIGVYRATRDLGISIPDSVAITGFGNTLYAADLTPSLTTIAAPIHHLGLRAAELALSGENTMVELSTDLVIRDSAG